MKNADTEVHSGSEWSWQTFPFQKQIPSISNRQAIVQKILYFLTYKLTSLQLTSLLTFLQAEQKSQILMMLMMMILLLPLMMMMVVAERGRMLGWLTSCGARSRRLLVLRLQGDTDSWLPQS